MVAVLLIVSALAFLHQRYQEMAGLQRGLPDLRRAYHSAGSGARGGGDRLGGCEPDRHRTLCRWVCFAPVDRRSPADKNKTIDPDRWRSDANGPGLLMSGSDGMGESCLPGPHRPIWLWPGPPPGRCGATAGPHRRRERGGRNSSSCGGRCPGIVNRHAVGLDGEGDLSGWWSQGPARVGSPAHGTSRTCHGIAVLDQSADGVLGRHAHAGMGAVAGLVLVRSSISTGGRRS